MKRVLVIGCPGSGKSVFARRLASLTGLPLYYLDLIWHKPDKTTVSREEFDRELGAILVQDCWIIDGNYQRTLALRLSRCDTAFLFDLPLAVCVAGAESRINRKRPDLPWVETGFDPEFRQWIVDFRANRLPELIDSLAKTDCVKIVFRRRADADEWLQRYRHPAIA